MGENDRLTTPSAAVNRSVASALIAEALAGMSTASFEGSAAVVDPSGHLIAFARTDGARFLTVDLAIGKAWTAASLGHPSHVWNKLAADPAFAPMAGLPKVVAIGGGYPLFAAGRLVGAIGVSGGTTEQDQDAALAAMRNAGFQSP